jgi:hypothetical protein
LETSNAEPLPAEVRVTHCSTCAAPIFWAALPSGKNCPIDAAPAAEGKYVIEAYGIQGASHGRAVQMALAGPDYDGWTRYESHFKTCAQASSHSRKGAR